MSNPTDTVDLQVEFTYVPTSKRADTPLYPFPDPRLELAHERTNPPTPLPFFEKVAG